MRATNQFSFALVVHGNIYIYIYMYICIFLYYRMAVYIHHRTIFFLASSVLVFWGCRSTDSLVEILARELEYIETHMPRRTERRL